MNMFRRERGSAAPVVPPGTTQEELDNPTPHSLNRQDPGVTSGSQGNHESTGEPNSKSQVSVVTKAPSSKSLEQPTDTQNPGIMKGVMQKVNPFRSSSQVSKTPSSESLEQGRGSDATQNPGVFKGVIQKVNPFKSSAQLPKNPRDDSANLQESDGAPEDKQNPGMVRGVIQKVNPFKSSLPKTEPQHPDLSSIGGSSADNNNVPEKQNPGMFKEMMQKVNPFRSNTRVAEGVCETDAVLPALSIQEDRSVHCEHSSSSESLDDTDIERHTIWYADAASSLEVKNQPPQASRKSEKTFVLKRILPGTFFGSGSKGSADPTPEAQETFQVQTLQLAEVPVPGETSLEPLDDVEGLLVWWKTVEGWDKWNEAKKDDEAEQVVEEAADRVFMAARLFVRFFNQRGASLQQRILELLALADSADNFHKKTVTASMGGGVASVAGSVTTITGLILAPFTAGTSLIVTAVGIGIATAGGVTSASANITDTVHSKTDRKKVEKMIQDYQEEIKDIRECLEFLQEGMETLADWNFEKYAESISKKHLNQNVKHVMKEGGRAGKALVINTETLINTVQVLGVTGGAAKAAQVMSVTTGVMSGLFLALDVFFLAKDSMELRKGAKTEFAAKIREVCKDLQDGLLELNRIKEELQKTMDGIEVEVQDEEENEELLKADLKKLAELEE